MYYAVCGSRDGWTFEKWFKLSEFANFDDPKAVARESAYGAAREVRRNGGRARVETRRVDEPAAGITGWAVSGRDMSA